MATKVLTDFTGGLNLFQHPTQLKDNEFQILENMEVRPTSVSDTLSYLALTARNSYRRLHTSTLGYVPRNLIEWVAPAGTARLFSGGYKSSKLYVDYIQSGALPATVTNVSNTSSVDTGLLVFLPFNQYLFYTDGNIAWRRFDGTNDVASGFTTKTKTGCTHKNRAFYGNDVTNSQPNYLWYSDVGTPETVGASSFFAVGDPFDPIVAIQDQNERLLIVKQFSTYVLYIAPDPVDSTLIQANPWKGTSASRGTLWTQDGTYILTQNTGLQLIRATTYTTIGNKLVNFLKGFQNSAAVFGYREDQVLLSTKNVNADTYNKRTFIYDNENIYQYNANFSVFCQNLGVLSFDSRFKAMENDGTNQYFVELDRLDSPAETTIPCVARTKEFDLDAPQQKKTISLLTHTAIFPDTTTVLTVKIYGDSALLDTQTFTPAATGLVRFSLRPNLSTNYANFFSFRFEYAQDATKAIKFAVLSLDIEYQVEQRKE